MSDLDTAPANRQKVTEKREQVVAEATQPLVLITEQQVAFSTAAAAMPMPITKPKRGLLSALRGLFAHSSEDVQSIAGQVPPPFYPPRRDEFVEDAAMGREMFRL